LAVEYIEVSGRGVKYTEDIESIHLIGYTIYPQMKYLGDEISCTPAVLKSHVIQNSTVCSTNTQWRIPVQLHG